MTVSVFARGNQFLQQGKLEEAIASYQKAIELNPQFASSYQNLGDALEKVGRIDEAIAAFRQAVAINPQSPWSLYKLGVILGQQGKFQEGVGYFRQAIDLEKDVPEFYLGLGSGLVKLEQWSQVEDCINQVVAMWDGKVEKLYRMSLQAEADFYLAEAKSGQGQCSEAVEFYSRSWEVNPGRVDCCLGWAGALGKLERWSEAMELYRQGVVLFEESGELWFGLGKALGQLGRWEEAVVESGRAVSLGFAGPEVRCHLGYALGELGRWEEAVVQYRLVLEVNPQSAFVRHQLGYALMQLGKWGEAEIESRKAAELNQRSALVGQQLRDVLRKLGEDEELKKVCKKANTLFELGKGEVETHNAKYFYDLGEQKTQLKAWEEAVSLYRRALEFEPESIKILDSLGQTLIHLEQWNEAIVCYLKAMELNPNSSLVAENLEKALHQRKIAQSSKFCEKLYLQIHADVAQAITKHNFKSGLDHWLKSGRFEDLEGKRERIPGYIENIYLRDNPDVAHHVNLGSFSSGYEHFLLYGWSEKRSLESFRINLGKGQQDGWFGLNIHKSIKQVESFKFQPTISIIVPVFNTDRRFLEICIDSVRNQVYPYWELCLVDDGSHQSHVREILLNYQELDSRIKVKFLEKNSGISAASNTALELASGEFIGLLDHDDEITYDALLEIVTAINENPNLDVIYSDEDKITVDGLSYDLTFKPGWSPDLLYSTMYIGHFTVYRKLIIREAGGFRSEFDGTQDYDLALRVSSLTNNYYHIPKILYHWRASDTSTAQSIDNKSYVIELQKKALEESLRRRGLEGEVVSTVGPGNWRVIYAITKFQPMVSIVIPTAGKDASIRGKNINLLCNCIQSIQNHAGYDNYEFVVIENGDLSDSTLEYLNTLDNLNLVRYNSPKFNLAEKINIGVDAAKGDFILLLNDDTEAITPNFMGNMLGLASIEGVGAVGVKLLYENHTIQHNGIVMIEGGPAHSMLGEHRLTRGPQNIFHITHNAIAATGACLLTRKDLYLKVGGFNEKLPLNYNDVSFCLKLREEGFRIVIDPKIEWFHFESLSKSGINIWELEQFLLLFGNVEDEFYNPNFKHSNPFYEIDTRVLKGIKNQHELEYIAWKNRRFVFRHSKNKTNTKVKFSIILSVYNVKKKYLRELEQTIFRQTYQNFEWIVVNDASSLPESVEWFEEIANCEKVKCINLESNLGIMGGYGTAFDAASGDYVIPVDQDDFLTLDALQIMAVYIEKNNWPAVLYSDEDKTNTASTVTSPFLKPDWDPLLFTNICYIAHLCAIKRTVAMEVRAYRDNEARGCHDWDTLWRVVRAGYKPFHVPELLYSWRIHPGSTASRATGTKPYTITSQYHVLTQHLRLTNLGSYFEIVQNDLFKHDGIWRLQPKINQLPKATLVVSISNPISKEDLIDYLGSYILPIDYPDFNIVLVFSDNSLNRQVESYFSGGFEIFNYKGVETKAVVAASPVSVLKLLVNDAVFCGEILAFVDSRLEPKSGSWLQELAGIVNGFDNVAVAGGRIFDSEERLLWAGGFFGVDGFLSCPDIGTRIDNSGYHGTLYCQRCVDGVSLLLWTAKRNFLVNLFTELSLDFSSGALATYLACFARTRKELVAYTPFATFTTKEKRLMVCPEIITEDMLNQNNFDVPKFSRYYHQLFDQSSSSSYQLGNPLKKITVLTDD